MLFVPKEFNNKEELLQMYLDFLKNKEASKEVYTVISDKLMDTIRELAGQ